MVKYGDLDLELPKLNWFENMYMLLNFYILLLSKEEEE